MKVESLMVGLAGSDRLQRRARRLATEAAADVFEKHAGVCKFANLSPTELAKAIAPVIAEELAASVARSIGQDVAQFAEGSRGD